MSDVLLTEISKKLSDILVAIKGSGGAASAKTPAPAPTSPPKTDANAVASDQTLTPAQKKVAADKAIAAAKVKKEAAAAAAAGGAKSVKGKRTVEQVREMIRSVAAKVDKQSALDILKDDGNGVEKVVDLKPEYYDAVYEACEVLLAGEAKTPAPAEEDDFA